MVKLHEIMPVKHALWVVKACNDDGYENTWYVQSLDDRGWTDLRNSIEDAGFSDIQRFKFDDNWISDGFDTLNTIIRSDYDLDAEEEDW